MRECEDGALTQIFIPSSTIIPFLLTISLIHNSYTVYELLGGNEQLYKGSIEERLYTQSSSNLRRDDMIGGYTGFLKEGRYQMVARWKRRNQERREINESRRVNVLNVHGVRTILIAAFGEEHLLLNGRPDWTIKEVRWILGELRCVKRREFVHVEAIRVLDDILKRT